MKNEELRKIIAECVQEVIQEQGMEEGFWSNVGKGLGITNDPDSGASHYDRFSQMHNKRADYKNTFDPKNPGKTGGKQSKMRAGSKEKVQKIKTDFEAKLKKAMRDAFSEAEVVGIDRAATKKIFMSSIMGIVNKYKKLEEEKTTEKNPEEKKSTCRVCHKPFTPSHGEHHRCPSCLSKQHTDAERATGVE